MVSVTDEAVVKSREPHDEEHPLLPIAHDRKSWSTPWKNLVCLMIHTQPDPSPVVSTIEEPLGKCKSQHSFPMLSHTGGWEHNAYDPRVWTRIQLVTRRSPVR
jgi:hypothetical protein